MTTVWLVRHAKAKNRLEWEAPDELRPLTRRGRREADAIAARLAAEDPAPERLVSSPFLRCVQTSRSWTPGCPTAAASTCAATFARSIPPSKD